MAAKCVKSPTEEHKFRFGKCIWCGQEEKAPKKPTIKELMKGEVLNGYVEAARVRPLTELPSAPEEFRAKELGMCYVEAYRFILKEGDYLVHGKITSPADKRVINHAWVEFETGWIWEPQTEKFMRKSDFEQFFEPKVEAKYTPKEATILALKSKHYGPWHSEKEEHTSSNPSEFSVCLFCPLCLRDFSIRIESPNRATAREAAIGKTVHCPVKHEFVVEPHNITTVQAFLRPAPWEVHPIYKQKFVYVGGVATPEEMPKPPSWLIGADIVEEKPLPPDGWRPTGAPTLKKEIPDALNTFIYQQEVRSPKYPEQVYHIQYRRDIFKKFLQEARKINKADKIEEASIYLIEHAPGITTRQMADVLGRGYWTIYRIVAKLLRPETIGKLKTEVEEQAAIEKWLPAETEETIKTLEVEARKIEKIPKATAGPLWRGQVTLYPMRHKTEDELLEELKHIFTLERYTPSPREWEEIKDQMRKQTDAWLKQSIMYYLETKPEVTA